MTNKEKLQIIDELSSNQENPIPLFTDLDSAIIGYTVSGDYSVAVYSYQKVIKAIMKNLNCSEDEAVDWYNYNTLRTIPYMGDNAPIIIETF